MKAFAVAATLALVAVPDIVSGQTLADLAKRLTAGDRVQVLDRSGRTAIGRLQKITDQEIVVAAEGTTVTVPGADVRKVAVPRHGKRNGFLIGAGLGTFFGLAVTRHAFDESGSQTAVVLTSAALYGAIGLGIGALVPSERVVYRAPEAGRTWSRAGGAPGFGLGVTLRW